MSDFKLTKPCKHIAFIMDGNGRWAKSRLMARTYGHKVACSRVIEILRECHRLGLEAVSLYAFSTENWNRPEDEINKLFEYLDDFFEKNIDELVENNIRFLVSGDISRLPIKTQKTIEECYIRTATNTGMFFNICLNYGSRIEIARACQLIAQEVKDGKLNIKDINEQTISNHLYTKDLPDIDLMIRTSGEQRLSNYLLYQNAYSEFIFTKTYWPDFSVDELHKCLEEYESRNRRFGGLENK